MGSSNRVHPAAATFRTDTDIHMEGSFYQFCHGKIRIPGLKTLMSLQRENEFQVFTFSTIVQESVVTDFLKTGWEHMHQITPDKFCIFQSDRPTGIPRLFSSGREDSLLRIDRQDAAVGDGNLMCISAEVFDGVAKAVKGFLDVGAPVFLIKAVAEICPLIGIAQFFTGSGKTQFSIFME